MGYNTNLRHATALYHVQTEDLGPKRALVETVIFIDGGRVLDTVRDPYPGAGRPEDVAPEQLRALMKSQHKRALLTVRDGEYDGSVAEGDGAAQAITSHTAKRSVRLVAGGVTFDPNGTLEGEADSSTAFAALWSRLVRIRP